MHTDMQTEKRIGLPAHCPVRWSADQAIKRWIATEEGQRLWQATCPVLSQEGFCNALAHTQTTRFGLLLTDEIGHDTGRSFPTPRCGRDGPSSPEW